MKTMAMAILGVVALSSVAFADEHPNVQQARDEMRAVRYDVAVPLLETALSAGGNDRGALVAIHKMMGEMLIPMGRTDDAKKHFKEMLVLSPGVNMGGMVSPKITDVLESAKRDLDGRKLEVSQTIDTQTRTVKIEVSSDPTGQVVGARAKFQDKFKSVKRVDVEGAGLLRIDLPNGAQKVEVYVVDKFGNQLQTFSLGNVAFGNSNGSGVGTVPPVQSDGGGSIVKKWWLWAGIAGVSGGLGVYSSLKVRDAISTRDNLDVNSPTYQQDFDAANAQGSRYAPLQYVGYGIAGVSAAAAIYFFISADDKKDEPKTVFAPMLAPNGAAGFSVSGSF